MNSSYRENSLSAGNSSGSQRQGKALPVPPLASHPTAAPPLFHHRPEPPLPGCISQPLGAGPGAEGAVLQGTSARPGQEQQPRRPELSHGWAAQGKGKHCSACPVLSSRAPNHGWCSAATLCPQHEWSQTPHLPPSPPSSCWPRPHRDRSATFSHACRATAAGAPTAPHPVLGAQGSPAPGCCLPREAREVQQRGRQEGGRRGPCCCPGFPRIKYEQPCCVILNC